MIQDFSFSENKRSGLEKTIIKKKPSVLYMTYIYVSIVKIAECLISVEPVKIN